ncbi:uncharacterized protein [Narcine bancroftii]|uniref:uncharacterized protein isoform X1 n=1 Tax=Narcine bancroftii TaxID=1343680 RepID=UPI0038314493
MTSYWQNLVMSPVWRLVQLFTAGFKVSRLKLQGCRQVVSFLGRMVSAKGTGISPVHRTAILHHPKPKTVKEMLSFLGLSGYSRQFIPSDGELTHPLQTLVNEQGMRNLWATLDWTAQAEMSFILLKQALITAIDLAIPNYRDPFFLDVSAKAHTINGVLFQKKGGGRCVLMYASITLDPTEDRHPPCTRHAAGVAKILQKVAHIVMGHALTVLTTHSIVAFVNLTAFTMTSLRQTRLEKILNAPNITLTHEGINMADNMGEGEPHSCEKRVLRDIKIRPDLQATPLREPDETLFTDGCCYRHPTDGLKAAYAVVRKTTGFEEIITGTVRGKESVQLAELQGMIAALEWAEGKEVNIYTDSAYVVGTIQVELSQWIRSGFLTAARTPTKHEKDVRKLAEALLKPRAVAVIKCKGHDKTDMVVARGNQEVDTAAKRAAGYGPQFIMMQAKRTVHDLLPPCEVGVIIQEQVKASPQEMMVWKERGATEDQGLWRSMDGRPVLPSGLMKPLLEEAHGLTNCGKKQMIRYLIHWWHPFLPAMVENHIRECKVCMTTSRGTVSVA